MRWLLDSNVWMEALAGIPYACLPCLTVVDSVTL